MKLFVRLLIILFSAYLLLLIPDFSEPRIISASEKPYSWNRDDFWKKQEQIFSSARTTNPQNIDSVISGLKLISEKNLAALQTEGLSPEDSIFRITLFSFFELAPYVAVRQENTGWYIRYYNQVRNAVKTKSQNWNMDSKPARNTVYEMLYGMRASVEEVLLQSDSAHFQEVMSVNEVPSQTPSAQIFGMTVHSGDILVSRGGAEVSALISRGNDYPGNFSHVAFIYIDDSTKTPHFIEAHIERGVAVSSLEKYTADRKLRIMVLRLRNDLPEMINDPMLPEKAAKFSFIESGRRHIPYDFKMNFQDSSSMFCSEVASSAYGKNGIQLWKSESTISSQGVVNWLSQFGVENFVTQMPSDLEYDPQLSVVAEWRSSEFLVKDHIDNAVMDVLYQAADEGKELKHNPFLLPAVRVIKLYCMIQNQFGIESVIPEGMSATQALKNNTLVDLHVSLKSETEKLVGKFIQENGYRPPYWQMVDLAKKAQSEL